MDLRCRILRPVQGPRKPWQPDRKWMQDSRNLVVMPLGFTGKSKLWYCASSYLLVTPEGLVLMPNFDNGSLPWEINNVRSVHCFARNNLMDISVTEKTQLGSIKTDFDKVEAINMDLRGDTLTINSIAIAD